MSRRTRSWLAGLGEVLHAVRDDPVLIAAAVLVAGGAVLGAYLLWSRL